MKKILFTLFAMLLTELGMAQSSMDFYGEWKVSADSENLDEWMLKSTLPENAEAHRWGRFFHFREDGTYQEYASAPCGLDDNHYSYEGKWSYDSINKCILLTDIKVINDRPNIYSTYKVLSDGSLRVIQHNGLSFSVKILKNWEKTSKK